MNTPSTFALATFMMSSMGSRRSAFRRVLPSLAAFALLLVVAALVDASPAAAHAVEELEEAPAWVEPIVLVSSLWTIPFVIWLAVRFRRTFFLSPSPPASTSQGAPSR